MHALLLTDLCNLLSSHLGANRIAIPTLMTLARIFASDATCLSAAGVDSKVYSRALALANRGVGTLKSIDRITAAMRVTVSALDLPHPDVRAAAAAALPPFLGHRFPRIRSASAEALYLALSEGERGDEMDPELEEALLETCWTDEVGDVPAKVAELVSVHVA